MPIDQPIPGIAVWPQILEHMGIKLRQHFEPLCVSDHEQSNVHTCMRDHNFKSGYCVVTQLTQTFVEFSYLHFDTSFFSIDHTLYTFNTDVWKWRSSKSCKLQTSYPGEITKRLLYTCPKSTLLITARDTVKHCTGLFNCGIHDNHAPKLFPRIFFPFATFQFRINRRQTWTI